MNRTAAIALIGTIISTAAGAEVCDYRPSNVIGGFGAGSVATGAGAAAVTGAGLKAAGFYTLVHSVTGATMLGSAAGGASAAGTVGIMGGTAGAIGTAAGVLMSPFVIIPAAVVAGGVAAYEGGCYLADKKRK